MKNKKAIWSPIPLQVRAEELKLDDEKKLIVDRFPSERVMRASQGTGDDPTEDWVMLMQESLKAACEDRVVVMLDFDHGLIEFSRILTHHKVPHAILQIEKTDLDQNGGHRQLQLCGKGFKGDLSVNGQTYFDNQLVDFVNENPHEVPVILYNSYIPEGVSLYNTRYLHVLSMDESYTNVSQMIGRINRMCNTTFNEKQLYMYVYKNSLEKDNYEKEVETRATWPRLNRYKS